MVLWVDSWAVFAWDLCGCSQLAAKSGSTKGSAELDFWGGLFKWLVVDTGCRLGDQLRLVLCSHNMVADYVKEQQKYEWQEMEAARPFKGYALN